MSQNIFEDNRDPIIVMGGHKMGTSFLYPLLYTFASMNSKKYYSTRRSNIKDCLENQTNTLPDNFKLDISRDDILFLRNGSNEWYKELKSRKNLKKFIRVIRNPLSVLNSSYFSHKYSHRTSGPNGKTAWTQLESQRDILLNYSDEDPVGFFLELSFMQSNIYHESIPPPFTQFNTFDEDNEFIKVFKFEDIINSPAQFLKDIVKFYGYNINDFKYPDNENFTFKSLSKGRQPGEIDKFAHFRSGIQDEWKNNLPKDIILYIKEHYRPFLLKYYSSEVYNI